MLGGMDIPKSVTIVVKCAENLEYSMPGSKKKPEKNNQATGAKTRRWHVVVAGGKKKMVSDVVDAQDGCPTWDTEFNIDLVSPTDPVVMLVLDGERRHIGQVVIPLAQVPRTGPPNFDPSRLRYSELEPTKKNSCPRGRLVYWIWATSYWPPGTKLDSKSKSHKGSISHLGRPKSRSRLSRLSQDSSALSDSESVLSVASSREHIQFPDSTSGQNQRPPSGSMTSLPRESYAPDGAVRSGPTDMDETEEDVAQTPKNLVELREARKSMFEHINDVSEASEDVVQTPKMRRLTYVPMSPNVRKSVDQSENAKARKSFFEPQKARESMYGETSKDASMSSNVHKSVDQSENAKARKSFFEPQKARKSIYGETSKVRRSILTTDPSKDEVRKDEIRKGSPRRSRKTDAGRAGSFGSTNRTPETPPSNNWFLHAEERPNKPLEDMSHRELLNYAMQQQRSAQVTRAELARVQNERDEINKKAEQSEKELDTVRASLADLRFRLLTAGLTDFLELPSAAGGRSTSLKFDNPFPGRDTRTAFSVGGFHAEPATTDVHQTFLDKLKKFGLGSQNDEPSVPSVPAVAPTTNWW